MQEKILKNIFNAFLKPYLEYGTLVWSGAPKTYLGKINKALNRSIRIILFKQKYDIVKLFYKYLGTLPLKQNIRFQQGKFMWKLNSQNPSNCLLIKFSLIHNQAINNANQQILIIPYYRTTTGKKSVLYQGYKLWNSEISVNAKLKETIKCFCKQFQADLLDSV